MKAIKWQRIHSPVVHELPANATVVFEVDDIAYRIRIGEDDVLIEQVPEDEEDMFTWANEKEEIPKKGKRSKK